MPSGRRNHSRWVSPERSPRALSAVGAIARMPAYCRPVDGPGQEHHPLDPRVAQYLQRRGQVARDRVPDDLPVHHHAVVRALIPAEELLEQREPVRRRRGRVEPYPQVVGIVEAERALGPGSCGGFDHQREADLLREAGRGGRRIGQPVARAGHAGGPQHRLHLRLVAEVAGRPRIHTGDAQALPSLRDWYLQLLQYRQEPLNRANTLTNALHRGGDLPGVQGVVDPPVRGQAAPQPRRHIALGLAGDQGQLGVRQTRCCLDEPRRRVEQIGRDKSGDHHA